ncbi:cardioactive peptide-like [Neodiprion fabricii]|uniref:cardioactive peptide-like n=1 Tax=Neodiprion fabricii TaxID=2872261 RepID=UPI001ED8D148|nr:cardioactive peptide-like [Neodiprion fabricii]XP_046421315.1 cardioactive peptide-like [Neodiprion fabricii]
MTNGAMKVSGFVSCAIVIIVFIAVVNSAVPQDRIDSQILDPFVVDAKAKRPFCNAFTGCGRKRSSPSAIQNLNPLGGEGMKLVRLPLPLYRALLHAASSQEMNNQIIDRQDQSAGDFNRLQEIPVQEFEIPAEKNQLRDQYES